MPELIRLHRRVRLFALLSLFLGLAATWGWVDRLGGKRVPAAPSWTADEMEDLHERLASANRSERLRLIQALGQTGGTRALDALMDTLRGTTNVQLRQAAVAELGRLGTPDALEELRQLACSGHPMLRSAAITAIASGPPALATDLLQRLLDQPDMLGQRGAIAYALGLTASPTAIERLISMANDQADSSRSSAIYALGSSGADQASAALQTLAKDASEDIRSSAIGALGMLGTPSAKRALVGHLDDRSSRIKLATLQALANYPDDEVSQLLQRMVSSTDPEVAQTALQALSGGDRPAPLSLLKQALQSPHRSVQQTALQALTRQETPEGKAVLVELLDNPELAGEAAWALTRLSVGSPDPALIATLNSDARDDVKFVALSSLGNGPIDEDTSKTLEQIVAAGGNKLSAAALSALARQGGKEVTPLLIQQLEQGSQSMRSTALRELGSSNDPAAREYLRHLALDGNTTAQDYVLRAAADDKSPQGEATLRHLLDSTDGGIRCAAAAALAQRGDSRARELLFEQAVTRGESRALWELGQMNDPDTRTRLWQALSDENVDSSIKQQIAGAVVQHGSFEQLTALARHQDPQVAATALYALANTRGSEAKQLLVESLASKDTTRREAALQGLETLGTPDAIDSIGQALYDDQTFDSAASILARTDGKQAIDLLSRRYGSASAEQRQRMINGMGNDPSKYGRELLESALDDPHPAVAGAAAQALARSPNPRIAARLVSVMQQSEDATLRQAIAASLRSLGGKPYEQYKSLIDQVLASHT